MAAPAVRVLEHELLVYRRAWRGSLFSSFLSPVLFLTAMGLGLGSLVDANAAAGSSTDAANAAALAGVSYLAFLAPGLLASTAMQTAAGESTFPVMAGLVWVKSFHGMTATPIRPSDVVIGKLTYIGLRLLLVLSVFFAVTVLFGAVTGPAAILAVPAALLTGLAFAAPIAAYSATQRDGNGFNALFRFGVIPLFLFSGTFFPISQLPEILQVVAVLTPLWHGVDLCRSLALGTAEPLLTAIHVLYLGTMAGVGVAAAFVTFRRRLVK
ncbi:MAG: ABC transporter permease [Chloroflexi bacterium]|jgi:lipooligosaccharide transport system permease protein|nr:ABC transporter permease [Chloroflexota bacterium]